MDLSRGLGDVYKRQDLVETLIGDIRDEYDTDEGDVSQESRTGDFEVDGLISLEDLMEETGIELPEGPYETASGFVMNFLGRIPVVNDVVGVNGVRITVLSMEGKRAGRLLISRNY
jgi:putative hemolysin